MPKERQFIRCYTKGLANLGCYSTQRNESYHWVVKRNLHWQMKLHIAVMQLMADIRKLVKEVKEEEDRSRRGLPLLLNREAFQHYVGRVTLYALKLLAPEWEAVKELSGNERESMDALDGPICSFACEFPIRYSLPCRH